MKQQLKELYDKAIAMAIGICDWEKSYIDSLQIDNTGEVSVHFRRDLRGGDIDTETVFLTEEDLKSDVKSVVEKYQEIAITKFAEERDKKEKERIREERKNRIAKEKAEQTLYKKLKAKYEGQ